MWGLAIRYKDHNKCKHGRCDTTYACHFNRKWIKHEMSPTEGSERRDEYIDCGGDGVDCYTSAGCSVTVAELRVFTWILSRIVNLDEVDDVQWHADNDSSDDSVVYSTLYSTEGRVTVHCTVQPGCQIRGQQQPSTTTYYYYYVPLPCYHVMTVRLPLLSNPSPLKQDLTHRHCTGAITANHIYSRTYREPRNF